MKTKVLFTIILTCLCLVSQAQEKKEDNTQKEPKGKAIINVFGNFHTGFGSENSYRGFELERSYLGYEYKLGKGISIKAVMDIGKSNAVEDYHRIAYIKNASIKWEKGKFTLNGGLISTNQFNFQEKFWGYRYIMKSFMDKYKFGSSADLGVSASYKFTDWISADAIVVNGEGYKKIQINSGLNYGLGVTLNPVKNFYIRLYGSINECSTTADKNTVNFAAFTGYKSDNFTLGAEYNYMWNSSYKKDANQNGYSIFSSVKLVKWAHLYARYDDIYSKGDWNISKDESSAIFGAQFTLCKYVKIAPNIRAEMPKQDGATNKFYAYISCFFGL